MSDLFDDILGAGQPDEDDLQTFEENAVAQDLALEKSIENPDTDPNKGEKEGRPVEEVVRKNDDGKPPEKLNPIAKVPDEGEGKKFKDNRFRKTLGRE